MKKKKESYSFEEMKKVFGGKYDFEEIPTKIQNLIADEVNLESGVFKKIVPLLENLFFYFRMFKHKNSTFHHRKIRMQ